MAVVWLSHDTGERFEPTLLADDLYSVCRGERSLLPAFEGCDRAGAAALLVRTANGGHREAWAVVVRPETSLLVNGEPIRLGIRLLDDRDELLLLDEKDDETASARIYFSSEQLARVEPFVSGPRPVCCARCKLSIKGGDVVRCPNPQCRQLHHQSDERLCWTYAERCGAPGCGQATAFDAGYVWTPDFL